MRNGFVIERAIASTGTKNRNNLAAATAVDRKIGAIECYDPAIAYQFAHSDDACIGKVHLLAFVFSEQRQNRGCLLRKRESNYYFASIHHFDDCAGLPSDSCCFGECF